MKAVLFDLDGTLLDTAADLVAALNHVRESEGLAAVRVADYRHLASRGAQGLIGAGLPAGGETVAAARKRAFLEFYAANSVLNTAPFDGIEPLLGALADRGVPWGVVTNKMERLTVPILAATGLLARAACVVCGDTLAKSKPHPAPVRLACEIIRVAPSEALMVGDDLRDIEAGRAAGTHTALAAYGYVDPGLDEGHLPGTYIVRQPLEVLEILDRGCGSDRLVQGIS